VILCGQLNFDVYECCVGSYYKGSHFRIVISVAGCERPFKFKCNREDYLKWINCIQCSINQSEGFLKSLKAPPTTKFWRFQIISKQQFIERADTFDIVLFQCNNTGAKITRAYSKSRFDHVAIALRFDANPSEVYILESTMNGGVHLTKFSNIQKHMGTFYKKIVLRKINHHRNAESIDILDKFLD